MKTHIDIWSNPDCVVELIPKPPDIPVTAVKALIKSRKGYLLVRNQKGWDIPGGHVEGDEGILLALNREIKEETGYDSDNYEFLAALVIHQLDPNSDYPKQSLINLYSADIVGEPEAIDSEVEEIAFFRKEKLSDVFPNWNEFTEAVFDLAPST